MSFGICAYCGESKRTEREHAVPLNLIPDSIRKDAQFVLIPACRDCNGSFSKDEEDFRNYCTLAGPENSAATENFNGPVRRGIRRHEGKGSGERLFSKIQVTEHDGQPEFRIFPDETMFRIVRKIARGLVYAHWKEVIPDCRVHAETFPKLHEILDSLEDAFHQVHPSTFRYWFDRDHSGAMHSGWFFSIYRTRNFVVRVFDSEEQKTSWLAANAGEAGESADGSIVHA